MALVPVAEALERLLEGAAALPSESIALADAAGSLGQRHGFGLAGNRPLQKPLERVLHR